MAIVLGETVSESFELGPTGQTFTRTASYINRASSVFAPTFSELSGGFYRYEYTPLVAGFFEWVGTSTIGLPVTINFDVEASAPTVTVVVAPSVSGSLTQTFEELIERVARRLGDYEPLTASANGTTTTFIDSFGITTAAEDMKGMMLVTSDTSVHRVTVFNDATNTITFAPAVGSAATTGINETAYLLNKRGKGFRLDEYKHAVNAAINDAFPLGLIEVYDDAVVTFDATSPSITIPPAFTHVHTVSWTDDDDYEHVLRAGTGTNESGWIVDSARGELRILGRPAWMADGLSVNLTGYGRQDRLDALSDTCALNAEYIVSRACYHLCFGALDKDQKFQQAATTYLNESMKLRTRLRTLSKPNRRSVRAA